MNLTPFESTPQTKPFKIQYAFTLKWPEIFVSFKISGPIENLVIPHIETKKIRANELWKQSCLEFFIAEKGASEYWEFNVSPSGLWNFYHLEDYRKNLKEDFRVQLTRFEREDDKKSIRISCILNCEGLPTINQPEVGISVVLSHLNQNNSFWAIKHTDQSPNFHRRESFILNPTKN